MIASEKRDAIADLMAEYVQLVDRDKLEEWVNLFTEDCLYKVVPRENVQQGLPGVLLVCLNRNMVHDRVVSLRVANEYNIHVDRHVNGAPRLTAQADGSVKAESNYALFQTNQEGESWLFSVGAYEDVIVFQGGKALFKERVVIVDTYAIPNLLATPI